MKAQTYSSDEIFEKRLLLLLPYYLMRYEKRLTAIASDGERSSEFIAECATLRTKLELVTLGEGEPLLYEELVELIIRVSDYLLATDEALRGKVRMAMGGEVLELMRDRAERLEREARERGFSQGLERGMEQGLERGLEQGLERGIEQGIATLSSMLKERGVDEALIASAIADMRAAQERS